METKIVTSKKYSLNWRDIGKGLIVAVGTAAFMVFPMAFNSETLDFNWKMVLGSGIAAGVAYLGKNFFTDSSIVITKAKDEAE